MGILVDAYAYVVGECLHFRGDRCRGTDIRNFMLRRCDLALGQFETSVTEDAVVPGQVRAKIFAKVVQLCS